MFQTINPATGEVLKNYNYLTTHEVDTILAEASLSFSLWRKTSLQTRVQTLQKLAALFRQRKTELAELMSQEMGKTVEEGEQEIEKCAACCEYFAENGPGFLEPQKVAANYAQSQIVLEPLGLIFSIMPWNFPFWQFIRFAAPSLMIGNVILLKHSDITAGCGAAIEKLCKDLFEKPLVFHVTIDHAEAAKLIQNPKIRGVTFTGSTRGGKEIGKVAGEALKKTVLELGGSDAYLILADADIDKAAEICAQGRMINNGQSCIAAKRFIAVKEIYSKFVDRLKVELSKYPTHPLAAKKFQTQLHEQVEKLKSWGGELLLGGEIPSRPGSFYPPSLIAFEKAAPMEVHREELFGPVAMVFQAANVEEALQIANASPFGLGGGVFSKDTMSAEKLVREKLEAGFVVINDFVKSDARLPFGGVKDSGHGRELSVFGFHEFCNIKTVAQGATL